MANNVTQVDGRGVFKGSDEQLCNSIDALLDLNAKGAVSHRVPGMAVTLLKAAADRIAATRPAPKADSALVGELRELADRAGIDLSNPMIWEPCGAEICDSEHGFQIASMASEIFPSNLDEANAELVSLLVNNLGNILAALSDRDVVLEEAAKVADQWRDENKLSKAKAAKQGNDELAAMLDGAAIECNAIGHAIRALKGGVDE